MQKALEDAQGDLTTLVETHYLIEVDQGDPAVHVRTTKTGGQEPGAGSGTWNTRSVVVFPRPAASKQTDICRKAQDLLKLCRSFLRLRVSVAGQSDKSAPAQNSTPKTDRTRMIAVARVWGGGGTRPDNDRCQVLSGAWPRCSRCRQAP